MPIRQVAILDAFEIRNFSKGLIVLQSYLRENENAVVTCGDYGTEDEAIFIYTDRKVNETTAFELKSYGWKQIEGVWAFLYKRKKNS